MLILEQLPNEPPYGGDTDIQTDTVELENIKRVVLYNKFKDIRSALKRYVFYYHTDKSDELLDLIDFINLILTYFNTIPYEQLVSILNNILDTLESTVDKGETNER